MFMKSILKSLSHAFQIIIIPASTFLTLPAMASSFNISWNQLNGTHTLKDGDRIQVVMLPGGAPAGKVEIILQLKNVTWWKGIQSGGIVLCQAQDSQTYSSAQFSVSDLNSHGLQLWKAKTFGIHTDVYNIYDATSNMAAGNSYYFIWSKD